ncbi:nucleotide-binding protein [Brucella thiophenivorans]|uniref:CobQ/CobB/MinD/ParA nucleotide binding domain protein n=1 Tax=Brucella thiophenivorans TaxID=571255 RepID=A0A256FV01_9HYPH|nr:division plane positioning ATPase MipZ [Brucella thiophenivorans]OYR18251.1 cobQ/CobB/MinD/ParA nucleotide binding domain protein [Brucella thiophenivorans]
MKSPSTPIESYLYNSIKDGVKNLILIHGDKGGVGKSIFALILIQLCLEKGLKVAVIDFDYVNDDVYKASDNVVARYKFEGVNENSWGKASAVTNSVDADVFVVNLPAQAEQFIAKHGSTWIGVMQKFMNVFTVWVYGKTKDSFNALGRYTVLKTGEPIFVAKSQFLPGSDEGFMQLEEKMASDKPFKLRGGSTFDFVEFPKSLTEKITFGSKNSEAKTERWSVERFLKENEGTWEGGFNYANVQKALEVMRGNLGFAEKDEDFDNE